MNIFKNILRNTKNSKLLEHARNGNVDLMKKVIRKGADVNVPYPKSRGYNMLHQAADQDNTEIAKLLIESGADIDALFMSYTPLHNATYKNNTKITELLIAKGADVKKVDEEGLTALHYAAKFKNTKIAKLLIESGADTYAVSNNGDDLGKNKFIQDISAKVDGERLKKVIEDNPNSKKSKVLDIVLKHHYNVTKEAKAEVLVNMTTPINQETRDNNPREDRANQRQQSRSNSPEIRMSL